MEASRNAPLAARGPAIVQTLHAEAIALRDQAHGDEASENQASQGCTNQY
ncbi:hypothetical protein OCS_05137 [Ophiocordyceps sinensis CO18]|uniref:Uncharacterized protein n=1 Tax=Ophiocordyceps sinensis (strain Co18 / CGMCC 3.14243) TaxID=911162 RepID=T5A169_OPHSC|nr:hypothetical protein OCS_05137 [Ophiocordyceps sinensis CO18]